MVEQLKIWSWRQMIVKTKMAPSTKLVILTLSTYMNDHGDSCFPSQQQLAEDTCLSERAVIKHIGIAAAKGFLVKEKRNLLGKKWAANQYRAAYPRGEPWSSLIGNEVAHNDSRGDRNSSQNGAWGEPRSSGGVNHVHTNSSIELSINTPVSPSGAAETKPHSSSKKRPSQAKEEDEPYTPQFEAFHKAYPNPSGRGRSKKKLALAAWKKATQRAPIDEIMAGVTRYHDHVDVKRGFEAGAATWLNQDRWTDEPAEPTKATHEWTPQRRTPMGSVAGG